MIFLYRPVGRRHGTIGVYEGDEERVQLSVEDWPEVIYFFAELKEV